VGEPLRHGSATGVYRVVAIADSLALPRIEGDTCVLLEETWPARLARHLAACSPRGEVVTRGMRARTVDTLSNEQEWLEHVRFAQPDAIVVQVGITDCAPRIFSRAETRLLNSRLVPGALRKRIIAQRAEHRSELTARAPLAKVYTSPETFAAHLRIFVGKVRGNAWPLAVYVLPIVAHAAYCEAKSPGHTANLRQYNELLAVAAAELGHPLVDLPGVGPDDADAYCSDGYHLSVLGNQRVAETLAALLALRP
jgi:lysophospholipase L1-like esterase